MTQRPFVDYYELLQLSPNATAETVERVYRLLAKRYHPDNQTTGNAARFAEMLAAYQVLSDTAARASYDVTYEENRANTWKIFDQQSAGDGRAQDKRLFHAILSLLYVARRRDPQSGGLGVLYIEKMLGCPQQHLDFPIWYLRQRGWVETLDSGQMAITIEGIDKLSTQELSLPQDRMLPASTGDSAPSVARDDDRSPEGGESSSSFARGGEMALERV